MKGRQGGNAGVLYRRGSVAKPLTSGWLPYLVMLTKRRWKLTFLTCYPKKGDSEPLHQPPRS